jgi:surfeit locus 1 family protein
VLSPRARRVVVLVAAVATALLSARLGVWQLDRAAEKRALQHEIDSRARLPALDDASLARDAAAAQAQHYRPVHLRGTWLAGHTVFLDNRQMNGRPGFFVLTPLLLAPDDAVLVQRGWVPRNAGDRTQVPDIPTPAGEVELAGRVAPPPSRLFDFGQPGQGVIRQNLDLVEFQAELGRRLRPLSVQQLAPSAGAPPDGLERDWPQPALNVSMHLGYAFQWFGLCALVTGLYVWFQLLRPRLRRGPAA